MEFLEILCLRVVGGGFVVLFGVGWVPTGSVLAMVELQSLLWLIFYPVFLVEAGVIGNFEIVVMGMMVMLAIVFEYFEILVSLMRIVIATMLMVGSCLLILCLSLGAMCSIQVGSGHRGLREMGLGLWGQS